MKDMKRFILFLLIFFFGICLSIQAEVRFSEAQLLEDRYVLFKSSSTTPWYGAYDSLFLHSFADGSMQQLTFFPENIDFIQASGQIQISNRYGVFRNEPDQFLLKPVPLMPCFSKGQPIQGGKILPIASSPDGKYILRLLPVSSAYADLLLINTQTSVQNKIADKIELFLEKKPAYWAPDSRHFIYSRGNKVLYFSMRQFEEKRILKEELRVLGKGNLHSVSWNKQNEVYLVYDNLVQRISSYEFFTQSIYRGLYLAGKIVGKLPWTFDPNFDDFWISKDERYILLCRDRRHLSLYFLDESRTGVYQNPQALPYLLLPRNLRVQKILWPLNRPITILAKSIDKSQGQILRLNVDKQGFDTTFTILEKGVNDIAISPEGNNVSIIKDNQVIIRDSKDWKIVRNIEYSAPLYSLWKNETELIIAGRYKVENFNLNDHNQKLICFSQAQDYGFQQNSHHVLLKNLDTVLQIQAQDKKQQIISEFKARERSIANKDYRVYIEQTSSTYYSNIIMLRDIKAYKTVSLFPRASQYYEKMPQKEASINLENFRHGRRTRRREIALVFNAIDSEEGLTEILLTLQKYKLRCTFFLNGEFIRRNPLAVLEISESGHEIGNLFYTYFDYSQADLKLGKDFIKKGLARNEDDYFDLTGNELSLLWHMPYYTVNSLILEAAGEMRYQYIGRDVDPLDWVPFYSKRNYDSLYLSAADVIERIIKEKKPGSIVPIRIGKVGKGREDYIFERLDILLDNLIGLGYDIVTVSTLIEHVK